MSRPVVHTARGPYRFQPVTFKQSISSASAIDLEGGTLAPVAIMAPFPWPDPGPSVRFGAVDGITGAQYLLRDADGIVTVTPAVGQAAIIPALPYFGLYLILRLVDSEGASYSPSSDLPVTVVLVPR